MKKKYSLILANTFCTDVKILISFKQLTLDESLLKQQQNSKNYIVNGFIK